MRVVPLGEIPVERLDSPIGEEAVGLGKRETGPLLDWTTPPFNFTGGYVGYFGYEVGRDIQGATLRKDAPKITSPDSYLFFIDKFLAFDHRQKYLYLTCLSEDKKEALHWFSEINMSLRGRSEARPPASEARQGRASLIPTKQSLSTTTNVTFTPSRSRQQYLKDIHACQKYLTAGDAYQICLTNQITTNIKTDWIKLFLALRRTNPAPGSAYINFGNFALISSSPEQFLHVDKKGWVTSKPMKGTARRGETIEKDELLAENLGKNEKDYAENIMIVDLIRNDLGKICVIGSIKVTKTLEVQTYATVHQLVSTIKGKLQPGATIIDLLEASFPGGSMTGVPKIAACEIIAKLEKTPREIYSGTFGFLSLNGTANLSMTIRTIIATKDNLSFGTGGAILTDSIPQEEYNEMLLKAQALIEAILKTTGAKTFHLNS
jgi:para-aminobenzoate synthetase